MKILFVDDSKIYHTFINEVFEVHPEKGDFVRQDFNTYQEAVDFIDTLDASDGYYLVGEFEGDSEVLLDLFALWEDGRF